MADTPLSGLSTTFPNGYSTSVRLLALDPLDTTMAVTGTDKGLPVSALLAEYVAAGSNITVTPGAGGITIASTASGGLTSVGLAVPSGLSVTGSPLTANGTLTITTALSGLLKGTGSGFSVASAGTDYLTPSGSGASLTGLTTGQLGTPPAASSRAALAQSWRRRLAPTTSLPPAAERGSPESC